MTDTALTTVDVAALEGLPIEEQIDAVTKAYHKWRRVEKVAAWQFGRVLMVIKEGKPGREWAAVRDRIGINRETARRYMRLAEGHDYAQIVQFATIDAALKALEPKRITPAPAPAPAPEAAELDTDPVAVVESVAAESGPDPADQREERLERLAIRTEDIDGPVVDGWAEKYDRQAVRECEHVSTINAQARTIQVLKRRDRSQCDDALGLPPSPETDAYLAKHWNVARKAA